MARPRRKRRFHVIERVEKEKFQHDEEKSLISQDFNEITLAISLFAGIWIFLSKIIDYLNNNIVNNNSFQVLAYLVLIFLFSELLIILFFILIKGYFISTRNMNPKLSAIAQFLLKNSLKYSILFSVLLIFKLFVDFIYKNLDKNKIYNIQYDLFTSIIIASFFVVFFYEYINFLTLEINSYLKTIRKDPNMQKNRGELRLKILTQKILLQLNQYELTRQFLNFISRKIIKTRVKINQDKTSKFLSDMNKISSFLSFLGEAYNKSIILFLLLIFFITAFFTMPTYLLTDSYSIDTFPQSNTNSDFITFTIKETGLQYNFIYITLNKLNSEGKLIKYVDNVTINRTKEALSNNSFMLGENYEDIWYLNINTSDLQPGNYMLHAEVTDDLSKISIFGTVKKHDDKLFSIAPRNATY